MLAVVHAPLTRGRVVRVAELGLPAFAELDLVVARNDEGRSMLVGPDGEEIADGLRITREALVLDLAIVPRGEATPRASGDHRLLGGCCGALLAHASFLLLAFIGRAGPGELDEQALVNYRGIAATLDVGGVVEGPGGAGSDAAPLERGSVAPSLATTRGGKAATHAPQARVSEDARSFGMVGLLANATPLAASPFAGLADETNELGGGAQGAGFGFFEGAGGLALSGVGEGGGGRGEGIGIGAEGTLGHGALFAAGCGGCGGSSGGRLGGTHTVRQLAYSVCHQPAGHEDCEGVMVNGRLPPETIQRIVRQSFGRFRACYEDGLVRNPALGGRVEMKFVIDRTGAVANATANGSFADGKVTSCLTRAYEAMTFPEPEGGIVTVVYPLVFAA